MPILPPLPSLLLFLLLFALPNLSLQVKTTTDMDDNLASIFNTTPKSNAANFNNLSSNPNTPHSNPNPSLSPPPPPMQRPNLAPFRPSIAVIVGVLTTMFSITFLLLLYAKHCKRSSSSAGNHRQHPSSSYGGGGAPRRNSGLERSVVDSLPLFRFSSLVGPKQQLDCAVCLSAFDTHHLLRLLPKCRHAFHVECVDTWLDSHSSCPLCRRRVDPEDILLSLRPRSPSPPPPSSKRLGPVDFILHRISGRHSSAGENSSAPAPDPPRRSGPARVDHRIVITDSASAAAPLPRRWSDFRPSDLLCLRSEMIIGGARSSCPASSKPTPSADLGRVDLQRKDVGLLRAEDEAASDIESGGRTVIYGGRCVSEITGLSRFRRDVEDRAVIRWLRFADHR